MLFPSATITDFLSSYSPGALILAFAAFFSALYATTSIVRALLDPLRDIPGPFVTRFTNLWLLRQYQSKAWGEINLALHQKYGDIVRIAPGQYSINNEDAIRTIYGHGSAFVKSDFYQAFDQLGKTVFSDRDPHTHAKARRSITSAYSMSSLVSYEPRINECNVILRQRLDEAVESGTVIDMARYSQCYAFDVIGMITFSQRLGFLDRCQDELGLIELLHKGQYRRSLGGVYPALFARFSEFLPRLSPTSMHYVIKRTMARLEEAQKETSKSEDESSDMVGKLIKAHRENPEKTTFRDIINVSGGNIGAGSDTTGITISSVIYHLARAPHALKRLREELTAARRSGRTSQPIKFAEAQKLPYLQATIKEALRVHSAVGFLLPRVVPPQGSVICGRHMPGGTVVGVNAHVTHMDTRIWGADAAEFRPERWLEDKQPPEIYFMPFGQGSRVCLGKNISLLEISKLIPEIIMQYDFELELAPHQKWTIENTFFAKPVELACRVYKREA